MNKQYSWGDYLTSPEPYTGYDTEAMIDAAKTIGSNAIGSAVGGIVSLPALPFYGAEGATDIINTVRGNFQRAPQTREGSNALQSLAESAPMQQLEKSTEYAGNRLASIGSIISPEAAAVGYATGKSWPELTGLYMGGPSTLGSGRNFSKLLDDVVDTSGVNRGQFKQGGTMSRPLSDAQRAVAEKLGIKPIRQTINGRPYDEILDYGMKVDPAGMTGSDGMSGRLGDVVDAPLLKVRPELQDIAVKVDPKTPAGAAWFDPTDNAIGLSSLDDLASIGTSQNLVHEMTHAATRGEGYPTGGSPVWGNQYRSSAIDDFITNRTGTTKAIRQSDEYKRAYETNLATVQASQPAHLNPMIAGRQAQEKARAMTEQQLIPNTAAEAGRISGLSDTDAYLHLTDEFGARTAAARADDVRVMEDEGYPQEFIQKTMEETPLRDPEGVNPNHLIDTFDGQRSARETAAPTRNRNRIGTTGQYVGAPPGVKSPQALGALRRKYQQTVEQGAGGANWYNDSSRFVQDVTNNDTAAQQMADILAVTSARTPVDGNLGHTIKGINQEAAGYPVSTGGFPAQMRPLISSILAGDKPALGLKRDPFAQNLSVNWAPERANRPVHDIWDGRAWGWEGKNGKPYEGGFTEPQHAWMDEQASIVDDRMNAQGVAGRTDWDPLRSQAAAWTGEKIAAGRVKPEDAAKHFGSYLDKYAANATHEQVPGAGSGQLEGMLDAPKAARDQYSADPLSSWLDDRGRDVLYSGLGVPTAPSRPATGVYTPKGTGVTEFNPMMVSRPLVSRQIDEAGNINLGEWDRDILNQVEALRAYTDVQNAGAWNTTLPGAKAEQQTGMELDIGRQPTADMMARLQELADAEGMIVSDTGQGATFFGGSKGGADLGKDMRRKGGLSDQIESITGGRPDRTKMESDFIDYEDKWPQGRGAATQHLFDQLDANPALAEKLDTPALRQKALNNMQRDTMFSEKLGLPLRQDIQHGRKVLGEQGLEGLRRELRDNPDLLAQILNEAMNGMT